uniref:collagen alpha-1(XII) chain-like isoform X3 n=1 Tax=Ciona intestinalis TaxID=7719 RepID=UPI00089DBA11|nr:collagen alpha-1(XII) chain-like isoform X3 [Ciona intestinalis]|eukprot:XP_009862300.2 collagen alpha-1(XII) chain-like isoform X3 [Ciona intestinalis]
MRIASSLLAVGILLLVSANDAANENETCRPRPLDIVFMLDGSRSVRPKNFQTVKDYVKNFTDIFEAFGPNDMQVGVIQFGSGVREEILLNQFYVRHELMEAIDNIRYMETGTMTGLALRKLVTETLTVEHGARVDNPIVHTVVVIITDGKSQDYSRGGVTKWTKEAKARGFEIFAIGIGRKANRKELLEMASEPKELHTFRVQNFNAIKRVDVNLKDRILCDLPPPTPTSLQAIHVTHTSAVASWTVDPSKEFLVDHYLLMYTRSDGQGKIELKEVYGNTTVDLVDLDPDVKYNISLVVATKNDVSVPTERQFKTLALGETVVLLTQPTLTTMTATWAPAGGDGLTGYELSYRPVSEEDTGGVGVGPPPALIVQNFGPDIHETVLTGLESDTMYSARVVPMHGDLVGQVGTDEERTDKLGPPEVVVANTSLSTLHSKWGGIQYEVDDWEVSLLSKSTGDVTTVMTQTGTQDKLFKMLTPGTDYQVDVIGHVTESGRRFSSPVGSASGTTDALTGPVVQVIDTTDTTAHVEWTDINFPTDSWTVKIYPKGRNRRFETLEVNGDENSAVFESLKPSTLYAVEVTANVHEAGRVFVSPLGRTLDSTKPAAPRNIEVIHREISELTAQFDPASGDHTGYEGECVKTDGTGEPVPGIIVDSEVPTITCENLDPATLYDVRVRTLLGDLKSQIIATSNKTLAPVAADILVTDATTHSLLVDWHAPTNVSVDGYMVTYKCDASELETRYVDGNTTSLVLTGLQPDTEYDITLKAIVNEEVSIPMSTSGTTLEEEIELQIDKVGYTDIEVSWTPSAVPHLDFYKLTSAPVRNPSMITEVNVGADDTSFTLTGLDTATEYTISVEAYYSASTSGTSTKTASTLALPPIGPLNFTDVSDTGFVVHWLPPTNLKPTSYEVTYWNDDTDAISVKGVRELFLPITELNAATEYNVSVTAIYFDSIESEPIIGNETTLNPIEGTCSCYNYMKSQEKLERTLSQLVKQIEYLTFQVENNAVGPQAIRPEQGISLRKRRDPVTNES